jgi:hypothetical protein
MFRMTADGKLYVLEPWPQEMPVIAWAGFSGWCHIKGSEFSMRAENGAAQYVKVDEDANGIWRCRLVHSTFTPPPAA